MKYKLLLLFTFILGSSLYLWFGKQSDENVEKNDASNAVSTEQKVDEKFEEQVKVVKNIDLSDKKDEIIDYSPAYLEATIGSWMKSRGYVSKADKDIYQNYDSAVLKELAESGDFVALEVLANLFIERRDVAMAESYLKLAAVYGSTSALHSMTIFSAPSRSEMRDDNRRHSAVIETIAIAKVMDMRGDPGLAGHAVTALNSSYERAMGKKLQLAPEDNDAINTKAKELYDSLVEERRRRGLMDFNNEYPAEVREFYGLSK